MPSTSDTPTIEAALGRTTTSNVMRDRIIDFVGRYGTNWYQNNVKEAFRTFVREEVQKYPLFQLTTDPTTRTKLQDAIAREVQTKLIDKQNLPIRLNRVVVGSILPPKGVVEQTTQTIVQEQRKITMVEFQKAEEAREKAEKQRGIADRAYRESLGLTAPEFVDLRRIEVQKEIVQHSPSALTVIMGLERVGINMPPLASDRLDSRMQMCWEYRDGDRSGRHPVLSPEPWWITSPPRHGRFSH